MAISQNIYLVQKERCQECVIKEKANNEHLNVVQISEIEWGLNVV